MLSEQKAGEKISQYVFMPPMDCFLKQKKMRNQRDTRLEILTVMNLIPGQQVFEKFVP